MKRIQVGSRLLLVVTTVVILNLSITACGQQRSISGRVSSGGTGLSGVTMMLSGKNSAKITTDTGGAYTFSNLANGSYTITPSKTGFIFAPTSRVETINDADITTVDFTAAPVSTFSVFGMVTSGYSGLSDVTMMLSGAASAMATTDAGGEYIFIGLANGGYTVTPSKTGFSFTPPNSVQTINNEDIISVNFTATPVSTFSLFGTVTAGGLGMSGVDMMLSGAGSASATTDSGGAYILSGLANGSYTIRPGKIGFTFSPPSSGQIISGANITAVNFIATSTQDKIVACPSSGTTNVTIRDFLFTPSAVALSVNGIVKWTNNGPSTHTVTSGTTPNNDGRFNSGNLAAGANICVQFLAAGSYPYFSTIDPSMAGSVTVK
jgi:plastocyanin